MHEGNKIAEHCCKEAYDDNGGLTLDLTTWHLTSALSHARFQLVKQESNTWLHTAIIIDCSKYQQSQHAEWSLAPCSKETSLRHCLVAFTTGT